MEAVRSHCDGRVQPPISLWITGHPHGGWGVQKVTHQAPPKGICIGLKLLFHLFSLRIHLRHVFLHQVDKKRRKDEGQEPDVPGGDELLERAEDKGRGPWRPWGRCWRWSPALPAL